MKINLPSIKNIKPSVRGLNFWLLKQKIKDYSIQKTSTIQLLQKIDIYHLCDVDRAKLIEITDAKEQQAFLQTHGKLDRSTGEMKSHSFVLQFLQMMEFMIAGPQGSARHSVTVKDTSNTNRAGSTSYFPNCTVAPSLEAEAGNSLYGIVVGTGVTAPATADYVVETIIAHGIAGGTLQYQPTSVGACSIVGANVDLVIARIFVNASGGAITLKNIGLVVACTFESGTIRYFLWAHDAVNQAVANAEIAVVSYDFRTTV